MISEPDLMGLQEIIRLHDEAFEKYQECPGSMWKSSEGAVTVHLGNYWERHPDGFESAPTVSVDVYSYALGPNRNHYFDSIRVAVEAVREWHADAFAHECGVDC